MAKRGEKAVSLGEKLRKQQYDAIWKEYCGFLDLTMQDYMKIQNRLMEEQIQLWSDCELGKSILKGRRPSGIDEFRSAAFSGTRPIHGQYPKECSILLENSYLFII